MANKLPWFTHDHNARNDDFIYRSETKFGPQGYSFWFKIIELLHEHGTGDILNMSQSRLCLELRSRWPVVRLYLDWSQTSGKLEFNLSGTEVQLQIKKFRERQSKLKSNLPSILPEPSGNLPIHKRDKKKENTTMGAVRFTPPSLSEVRAYCEERKNTIDPQGWIDYNMARGWKFKGGQTMKDWKAAIRTWEKNDYGQRKQQPDRDFDVQ